jgi:hypothetical protein
MRYVEVPSRLPRLLPDATAVGLFLHFMMCDAHPAFSKKARARQLVVTALTLSVYRIIVKMDMSRH